MDSTNEKQHGTSHPEVANATPNDKVPMDENPRGEACLHEAQPIASDSNEADANSPKGARFLVLYSCILLGNFFTGYVGIHDRLQTPT